MGRMEREEPGEESGVGMGIIWVLSDTGAYSVLFGSGAKTVLEPVLNKTKPHTLAYMPDLL